MPTCACTDGGVYYSDISETNFCWLLAFPCVAKGQDVVTQQWADCESLKWYLVEIIAYISTFLFCCL